jgi:DMSO reductase anchor subunit
MNRMPMSSGRAQKRFHETPLIIFTILGVAGAGLGSAHLLRLGFGGGSMALTPGEGSLLCLLLLLGMAISTGHLGKPLRGPLALKGVGRSPLSNEVLAFGVVVAAGALSLGVARVFPGATALLGPLGLLASLASVAFLLALGALYNLPGQLGWQGPAVGQPLVLGTAWGLVMGPWVVASPSEAILHWVLLGLLAVDGGLTLLRARRTRPSQGEGVPVYPHLLTWGRRLLVLRVFSSVALGTLAVLNLWWVMGALALSLALVLDRVVFYVLAVRVTTESEVARVEALL